MNPDAQGSVTVASEFSSSDGALFVATLAQLMTQLPGWRVPLAEPERRAVTNPFTGELIPDVLTTDPGPPTHPAIPLKFPFPCVLLPSREDWEQNLLALDLALSGEPRLPDEVWEDGWFELMFERGLCEQPLLGGDDDVGDPRYMYEVPERLTERLLQLRASDVDLVAKAWLARCWESAAGPAEYLSRFCELARLAASTNGRLFSWNIHPLHRAQPGVPLCNTVSHQRRF